MDITHPNFSTGKPCRCPWGAERIHRDPEHFGRTASKIDWLKGRPDYESNLKVRDAVNILHHNYPPSADAMFPWIVREVKKGRLDIRQKDQDALRSLEEQGAGLDDGEYHMRIRGANHGRGMMLTVPTEHQPEGLNFLPEHAGEWTTMLEDMGKRRKGLDLMQHTFPELAQKMDEYQPEWEDRQRQHLGDVMHKFDDGWTVRRLKDYEEARREGEEMGSCVGSYQPDLIYSLRDKGNRPHATVEIRPTRHDDQGNGLPHGGEVYQVQGKENYEPDSEYMNRLGEWMDSFSPEDKPSANTQRTTVPVPHDPNEFLYYYEPERDYDDDRYRLSPEQAYAMNLDSDDDEFDYQGPPNWENIAEHSLRRGWNSKGPLHNERTISQMVDAAHEMGLQDEMAQGFESQQPAVEQEFWNEHYTPYHWKPPEDQFDDWWKGRYLNMAMNGNALRRDPDGNPVGPPPPAPIHPDQQQLFHPTDPQTPWSDYPIPTVHAMPEPMGQPLAKVAATDHPLYHRWVFSPSSGEVDLANNNEPEVRYHGDMARERNEPDLVHGYAYRIGGGYRLTNWEHKPVEDPFVVAQVMRKLRGEQGPANQPDWESSADDFDRMHAGMPGEL